MEKTCGNCGQLNQNDYEMCVKCGKDLTLLSPKVERKLQYGFSIGSLILAGIVAIPIFWLDMMLIDSAWALSYFAGHYGDRYYIVVIASSIYLLLTIIGIVFASIGIKKGTKIISLFGLAINLALIVIVLIRAMGLYVAFFL
ncbi:MAG TPA: hypothetical protein VMZ29_13155 [Candidatus Bathyarchaeia archaeon]|nr:hypothetical protein [Candidatus Bathyarchaeia archaeon]